MRNSLIPALAGMLAAAAAGSAYGFGGQIAVGMNAANEVEDIAVPFTADAVLETAEHTIQSKIYYADGKLRDEIAFGGQQMIYISRADLGTIWMVMPANGMNMYSEMPYGESNEQIQEFRIIEREVVGPETVNGMATTKHRVIYESDGGRYGGFTWFNDDNIAVRSFMVTETDGERQRINFEMSNLEIGPVEESLFELPANAQKLDFSGLGGLAGGGGLPGFGGDSNSGGSPGGEAVSPGVAEEMLDAAERGAKDAAVEETERGVRDAVKRGIRGIFGR